MLRWFNKFEKLTEDGKVVDTIDSLDVIYAFFQNCYHLKDWVKSDSSIPKELREGVEQAINDNDSMVVCDCLANGTKHKIIEMHRRRKRIKSIVFRPTIAITAVMDHPEKSKGRYVWNLIVNDQEEIGGIDLARRCVGFWEAYLKDELSRTRVG